VDVEEKVQNGSMSEFADIPSAMAYGSSLLRGDRVRFRALADEDLLALVSWWSAGDWAMLQQTLVKPRSASDIESMFRLWSSNNSSSGAGFSVVNEQDELVGHASLWGLMLPERIATMSMMIGPDYVGQGLGPDAVRTLCRYGFAELGAHKIELRTWAFNTRGIAAYKKVGFVQEGRRRAAVFHDGDFHDEVLMGLLESELTEPNRPS
jgi:RimJ/RimL family protein N-acetyltransferase